MRMPMYRPLRRDFKVLKRLLAGTALNLALCLATVSFGQNLSGAGTADDAAPLFNQGLQDRTGWENWFASLIGDERTGAEFWAGQRSLPDPGNCLGTPDFRKGCREAKARLTGPDTLRKSEPSYRQGWNSYVATEMPGSVQPSVSSALDTTQQKIEAAKLEKAKAEAELAKAEAEKARAEAEKAKAEAEVASAKKGPPSALPASPPVVPTAMTAPNTPPAQPAVAGPATMPEQEKQFLATISNFAAKYGSAPNQMAQGGLRPQRAKAVCDLLGDGEVQNWVGTVQLLSSNGAGKGVLDVALADNATVKTWNNSISDIADETLITPGTPLHEAAVQLSRDQRIVFSGTFVKGDEDCFREGSITQRGSMTDPDWIFRFSAIKPAS